MMIQCCRYCVPPVRHIGCHGTCEKYKKEKIELEKERAYEKERRRYELHNSDFNQIGLANAKHHLRKGEGK